MGDKTCTASQTEKSEQTVIDIQNEQGTFATDPCYGPARVNVVNVDEAKRSVTLQVPASGNTSPKPVVARWSREDVWALCPSTLDCDEERLPKIDTSGILYLSSTFITANGLAAAAKWPNCFAGPEIEYRPLRIRPSSIKLTGVELKTGSGSVERDIELLAPQMVAPDQTITIDGSPLTLNLSQDGFARMLAPPWASLDALRQARTTIGSLDPMQPARDLAQAWAAVAEWESLLKYDYDHARESCSYTEAIEIIKDIRRINRAARSR